MQVGSNSYYGSYFIIEHTDGTHAMYAHHGLEESMWQKELRLVLVGSLMNKKYRFVFTFLLLFVFSQGFMYSEEVEPLTLDDFSLIGENGERISLDDTVLNPFFETLSVISETVWYQNESDERATVLKRIFSNGLIIRFWQWGGVLYNISIDNSNYCTIRGLIDLDSEIEEILSFYGIPTFTEYTQEEIIYIYEEPENNLKDVRYAMFSYQLIFHVSKESNRILQIELNKRYGN